MIILRAFRKRGPSSRRRARPLAHQHRSMYSAKTQPVTHPLRCKSAAISRFMTPSVRINLQSAPHCLESATHKRTNRWLRCRKVAVLEAIELLRQGTSPPKITPGQSAMIQPTSKTRARASCTIGMHTVSETRSLSENSSTKRLKKS